MGDLSQAISIIVKIINYIPPSILVLIPTIIFGFFIIAGFLKGLFRGFGRSFKFLILFLLAASLSFGAYALLFAKDSFDTKILEYANIGLQQFGLKTLNSYLNVSESLDSLSTVFIDYIVNGELLQSPMVKTIVQTLINAADGSYVRCLLEIMMRFSLFFVFLIFFWVFQAILYIFYLIFFSEGRKKKKQNKKYRRGYRESPYRKHALWGGLIGIGRGLISALIFFSFFGSFAYIFTGGEYKEKPVENETNTDSSENMQAITSIYNLFKTYGTTGIGAILEGAKDANNIPYYLMISDFISKGYLEDKKADISEYILAREELAIITAIADEAVQYAIRNNIEYSPDRQMEIINSMLRDENFQDSITNIVNRISNEKIFRSLAKSTLDSLIQSFANEEGKNEYLKLFFGTKNGNIPLSISSFIINKDNFSTLVKLAIKGYLFVQDMGSMDTLTYMCDHSDQINDFLNIMMKLNIFTDPLLSKTLNDKFQQVVAMSIEDLDTTQLKGIDLSYIKDINFLDKFNEKGEKIADGEIRNLIILVKDILDSKIILDLNDTSKVITALTSKSVGSDKTLLVKLLDSEVIYLTIATILDSNMMKTDSLSIYIPEECYSLVGTKKYVNKSEIVVMFNALAEITSKVDFSNLGELTTTDYINLISDEAIINSLMNSKILQGTLAMTMSSSLLSEFIKIPSHLDYFEKDTQGNYIIDENGNKTVVKEVMDLWLDQTVDGKQVDGETRKLVNSILQLNVLKLIPQGNNPIDISPLMKLTEKEIDEAFKSDILRYSLSNMLTTLDLGEYKIVVPNAAMQASDNATEVAIKSSEFYKLFNVIKTISGYDEEANLPFDPATIKFNFNTILENEEILLSSSILHATVINMMVLLFDSQEFLVISDELSSDLQNDKLVKDFYNTLFVTTHEISKLLQAVKVLGIIAEDGAIKEVGIGLIKTLNEQVSSIDTSKKIDVVLQSDIIWASISGLIIPKDGTKPIIPLVVPKEVISGKKIVQQEIKNVVEAATNFIDENNNFKIDYKILTNPQTVDDILNCYIIEATIAENVAKLLTTNDLIKLPSTFKYNAEDDSYLSNWLSKRDSNLNIIVGCEGELRFIIDSANELSILESLGMGDFKFNITNIINKTQEQVEIITNSLVISYTLSSLLNSQEQIVVPISIRENIVEDLYTIHSVEVYRTFQALNQIIGSTGDFENLTINVAKVLSRAVRDAITNSYIMTATVVNVILDSTKTGSSLADVVSIPTDYQVVIGEGETVKSVLERDFDKTLWKTENEVNLMLQGLDALNIVNNETGQFNDIGVTTITDLEKLYETTNNKRVDVVLLSSVLWLSLSERLADAESLGLTILDEVYLSLSDVENRFIIKAEIKSLVTSLGVVALDGLDNFANIDVSLLFSGGKLDLLLSSLILEATVANITYQAINGVVIVPNKLNLFDKDNYVNWLSGRDAEGAFIPSEYGELKNLLNALETLGLTSGIGGTGGFNFDINSLLKIEEEKIDIILKSKIVHVTFSDKINGMSLGNIGLVQAAIAFSKDLEYGDGKNIIVAEELKNLIISLQTLVGDNGDVSSMTFSLDTILDANKQSKILKSAILKSTIIVKLSQTLASVLDVPTAFGNPYNSLTVSIVSYEANSWIKYHELENLLAGIKAFGLTITGEGVTFDTNLIKSLNDTDSSSLSKTKLDVVTDSYILWLTLSTKLKDIRALMISTANYETNIETDLADTSKYYLLKLELKHLVQALNILVSGDLSNGSSIATNYANVSSNMDVLAESFVIRTMISKTLLSSQALMVDDKACIRTEDNYLVVSKEELLALVKAFTLLSLSDFNTAVGATQVDTLKSLTNEEIDSIVDSNVMWLMLSDLVKNAFDVFNLIPYGNKISYTVTKVDSIHKYDGNWIVKQLDKELVSKSDFVKIKNIAI